MKLENIKFKAKRLDNREWVEGDLMKESYSARIIEHTSKADNWGSVDPSTVCQFTGLKDCEGKELFEHDLIHFAGYNNTAEVIWSVSSCAFMAVHENKHSYLLHYVIKICKIEKIGNKFDNEK